ncbi:MAG: cupin domain-containing protein, partial [Acidimicrobiales bacterium]
MALLGSKLPDHGLSEFYDSLGASHLQPLWTQNRSLMPGEPRPSTLPWLWPWEVLRDRVSEAGRLVSIDRGGDRRVLSLANPGLGGRPFATSTLWGAVQYLGPGEGAPAHRHSQGAVRFVIEGSGVWTTVDGDACDMAPGDLVLTPAWTWHDHESGSDGPMIWFDGLDMPLVESLDAQFFELDPAGDYQQVRGRNLSASSAGASGLAERAVPPSPDEAHSPLLIYRWSETTAELDRALEAGGGTVARVE